MAQQIDTQNPDDLIEKARDVEKKLLSIFLSFPETLKDYSDRVKSDYFMETEYALMYDLLADMDAQNIPIDYLTVGTQIRESENQLDKILTDSIVADLFYNPPTELAAGMLVDRLIRHSQIRSLANIGSDLYDEVHKQSVNIGALIAKTKDQLEEVAQANQTINIRDISAPQLLKSTLLDYRKRAEDEKNNKGGVSGLSTGFSTLDAFTNGLKPGELVIIAGRPASGKSTFAMNICEHAGFINQEYKKPVVVFTLEMPYNQVLMRSIARLGTVNQKSLASFQLSPEDWTRIQAAVATISQAGNVYIDDSSYGLTVEKLRARVRQIAMEHIDPETNEPQMGIVMVDYLQLLEAEQNFRDRHLLIAHIAKSLKALAREFKCPVLALSQLNRNVDSRGPDARPTNADLRESGAIEQDADIVIMVHRPETNAPKEQKEALRGKAEIIITKNRQGEIGTIFCKFEGQYSRFIDDETTSYIKG